MESPTRVLAAISTALWVVAAAAVVDMAAGNPTAITGVIGAGFGGTVFAASAWAMWRQDRRFARSTHNSRRSTGPRL